MEEWISDNVASFPEVDFKLIIKIYDYYFSNHPLGPNQNRLGNIYFTKDFDPIGFFVFRFDFPAWSDQPFSGVHRRLPRGKLHPKIIPMSTDQNPIFSEDQAIKASFESWIPLPGNFQPCDDIWKYSEPLTPFTKQQYQNFADFFSKGIYYGSKVLMYNGQWHVDNKPLSVLEFEIACTREFAPISKLLRFVRNMDKNRALVYHMDDQKMQVYRAEQIGTSTELIKSVPYPVFHYSIPVEPPLIETSKK